MSEQVGVCRSRKAKEKEPELGTGLVQSQTLAGSQGLQGRGWQAGGSGLGWARVSEGESQPSVTPGCQPMG